MTDVSTTTPCPDRDAWSGFYAGQVPPAALTALASHLSSCTLCREMLHDLAVETPDDADPLVALLRTGAEPADGYEFEAACRNAVARAGSLLTDGMLAAPPPAPLPETLGEYRIVRLIGHGGMGTVYRAVHQRLGREVALKVITPERTRVGTVERFRREAAAHGKLDHPNVVRATDAGQADGVAYLVMDLVDGIDLDRLVRAGGRLSVAAACELARQAATGLHHLTTHGLVHRDVKPSNLMLDRRGDVKVLDFGLAVVVEGPRTGPALTDAGQVLGTFDYLAPEQADPVRPVDARADVYSLGCVLYFLLTGTAPYSGPAYATPLSKVLAHSSGPVPAVRLARPDVPAGLAAILTRMLAKNPDDRFPTSAAVAVALAPFCAGCDLTALLASAGIDPDAPTSGPTSLVPATRPVPNRPQSRSHRPVLLTVAAVLLLGGGLSAAVRFWMFPPEPAPEVARTEPPKEPEAVPPVPPSPSDPQPDPVPEEKPAKWVLPVALLGFEERGAGSKDLGAKVGDLLFAKLAAKPDLFLVDRADLKKVLDEQSLTLSGAVKADEAVQVGQLTGARLLVTGSVVQSDKKLYLVAKVISAETGRVAGASVEGAVSDDLGVLAGKLADAIADAVAKHGDKLAPRPAPVKDRVAELNKKLGAGARPVLGIQVAERHVGAPAIDPAAQTEVTKLAKDLGFTVIDLDEGGKGKADVLVTGDGFSEVAGRAGGLVSVRARVELKAVDRRTGKVLASDRQTAVVVDVSEQIAGKAALQAAADALAERVLPKLVAPETKK